MKINATFDKNGYLYNFATLGTVDGGIELEVPEGISEEDLMENYTAYKLEDGQLVLDEEKLVALQEATAQVKLSSRYIPSEAQSAVAVGRMLLAQMTDLTSDDQLRVSGLYETWHEKTYSVGDICNYNGQTWKCYASLDPSLSPGVTPNVPSWSNFFKPLHGTTPTTARPYVPVQGVHDMYHTGEYMIYTDEMLYICKQDTNFSPEDYAAAWELIDGV